MMKKLVLQPFTYGPEKFLLSFGLSLAFLGCLVQMTTTSRTFSIFQFEDIHTHPTFLQLVADFSITSFTLILTLFGLGYLINSKTRFIDVVNTVLIAKVPLSPLIFIPIGALMTTLDKVENQFVVYGKIPVHFVTMLFQLSLLTLAIILLYFFGYYLYQGFKTATHLKKKKHLVLLVVLVVCIEFLNPFLTTLY